MQSQRVPYQKIMFVCVNERANGEACCSARQSGAIASALKDRVKALGLSKFIRVSKSGCQDVCAKGPNVMVFPEYVWYHGVTLDDVERIVQDTVSGNRSKAIVERDAEGGIPETMAETQAAGDRRRVNDGTRRRAGSQAVISRSRTAHRAGR